MKLQSIAVQEVRERLATRQLARWDVLAARVMPGPESDLVLEGIPMICPAEARDEILADLRGGHRRARRTLPGDDPAAFFKRFGFVYHHLWLNLTALPPMPTVMTPEGDVLAPTTAVFDVVDHAAVASALATHPALDRQEDGSFGWLQPTDSHARVLRHVTLTAGRLSLDAMSEARADRGREFLEQLLGDAIRFRVTSHESLEQALARPAREQPDRAPAIPPEL